MGASIAIGSEAQTPAPKPLPPELIDAIRFTIAEIRVEGNTVVPAETLLDAVKPFLGPGKRLEDLNGARGAILQTTAIGASSC